VKNEKPRLPAGPTTCRKPRPCVARLAVESDPHPVCQVVSAGAYADDSRRECAPRSGLIVALVPESGRIIPEMGTGASRDRQSAVASALFTPVQQRVLGLLFGQPERRFQSAELIRLAGSGTGAVHRQLQRLETAGLVTVSRDGNHKYYTARKDAPVFSELHGLVVKTVGIVEPLRAALTAIADEIDLAFVFGSLAKGSEGAESDLDLLVVTDKLAYADVYSALAAAERTLGRTINPTVYTRAEWKEKRTRHDSFAARITSQRRLFVIGGDDDAQ
jgi:predicted nucleotidyltransferase